MGTTSTDEGLATLQARYEALPNKRSREGMAMRRAIARAKASADQEEGSTFKEPDYRGEPAYDPEPEAVEPETEEADVIPGGFASTSSARSSSSATVVETKDWTIKRPAKSSKKAAHDEEDMGILPNLETLHDTERRAVYWMGVIPGDTKMGRGAPPMHQFDGIGGGVSFHEWWTPHEGIGQDGSPRRGQFPGYLMSMSESQVAQLREGLRSSLVRWRVREGFHKHGHIIRIPSVETISTLKSRLGLNKAEVARIKVRAAGFQIMEGDEPVARYIYCVKVTGSEAIAGGRWRPSMTLPPSVEELGTIEGP